jgi:GT2 family glycosyltransferase
MLSVLIVNWNTKDRLLACLESLARHPSEEPVEVVLVDNASADGSAEAVRAWAEDRNLPFRLEVLEPGKNLGYAAGNNLAFSHAQGQWLLTLNPDTEVLEETLERALATLKRRPKDGALGARLVGPEGDVQRSVRGFPSLLGIVGALLRLDRSFPRGRFGSYTLPDFDYELEQDAPQPMGTFLLFRREALAAVGDPARPFDERFPIFFNEVDLLYRMRKAGWGCVYDPAVRVLHHGGASTRQVRPKMIWESHRSLIRYLNKHTLRWWNAPALGLVALVVWIGALVRARTYDVGFRP